MDTLKYLIIDFLDNNDKGITLNGQTWTSNLNWFYGLNDDVSDDIEINFDVDTCEFYVVEYGELENELDIYIVEDDLKKLSELFINDLPYTIEQYINNEIN